VALLDRHTVAIESVGFTGCCGRCSTDRGEGWCWPTPRSPRVGRRRLKTDRENSLNSPSCSPRTTADELRASHGGADSQGLDASSQWLLAAASAGAVPRQEHHERQQPARSGAHAKRRVIRYLKAQGEKLPRGTWPCSGNASINWRSPSRQIDQAERTIGEMIRVKTSETCMEFW